MVVRERFWSKAIHDILSDLLEEDLHAKRVNSLCDATLGVLHSGSLAILTIDQGLAAARSLRPKHAIKQVDRLLSNPAINVDDILVRWVPFVIGARDTIVVAMDWTDFDADKQVTIMSSHHYGRPMRLWFRSALDEGARSRTPNSTSIGCWYGLLNCCRQGSRYASWPIAASVICG